MKVREFTHTISLALASVVLLCSAAKVNAQGNSAPEMPVFNASKIAGLPVSTESHARQLTRAAAAQPMPVLSANEFGTKAGDAGTSKMGVYQCRSSGATSIDFQINITAQAPNQNAATFTMARQDAGGQFLGHLVPPLSRGDAGFFATTAGICG